MSEGARVALSIAAAGRAVSRWPSDSIVTNSKLLYIMPDSSLSFGTRFRNSFCEMKWRLLWRRLRLGWVSTNQMYDSLCTMTCRRTLNLTIRKRGGPGEMVYRLKRYCCTTRRIASESWDSLRTCKMLNSGKLNSTN